jgi:hypothetical protein
MTIPKESLYLERSIGLGRIAEHSPQTHIRSYAAEGSGLAFGRAAMDGTDPEKQIKLYASQTGKFRGIVGYSTEAGDLDNELYQDEDVCAIIDQGIVTVMTEEDVTDITTQSVRIRTDTTGITASAGVFRVTADSGKTVVLSGAEWRSEGTSGTGVKLYLAPPFSITAD